LSVFDGFHYTRLPADVLERNGYACDSSMDEGGDDAGGFHQATRWGRTG